MRDSSSQRQGRWRRKHSNQTKSGGESSSRTLEWERFEFGHSPKGDDRFYNNGRPTAIETSGGDGDQEGQDLEALERLEAEADAEARRCLDAGFRAWEGLDPKLVSRALSALRPYVGDDRVNRIESVLSKRTRHARFLFENPGNPSNVWACLRTLDSFGIQHVDVVVQSQRYKGRAALSQKRGMRTAMGSARWLTIRNHPTTADGVRALREVENCRIYASDVNTDASDIRDVDWGNGVGADRNDNDDVDVFDDDRPICIVMGNEETGISDEMRDLVDGTFYLPMVGFAESFNLSVATAITLAHLSAASSSSRKSGPIRPGDLSKHQRDCLLLKGMINSLPQRRMADALLRRADVVLPSEFIQLL